jgi:protein SCO1/2
MPRTLGQAMNHRPSLLIPVDYACKTLCGPVVALAAAALAQSGLKPERDYRVVAVGLDPKSTAEEARAMKQAQLGEGSLARATVFLTADAAALQQITAALGYRYAEDNENRQFAHPAAVFALNAEGRVARVLSGLGLTPTDLRLALLEAGEARTGNLADRAILLCYGFDPVAGVYTLAIHRLLALLSLLTMAALACAVGIMRGQEARSRMPAAARDQSHNDAGRCVKELHAKP